MPPLQEGLIPTNGVPSGSIFTLLLRIMRTTAASLLCLNRLPSSQAGNSEHSGSAPKQTRTAWCTLNFYTSYHFLSMNMKHIWQDNQTSAKHSGTRSNYYNVIKMHNQYDALLRTRYIRIYDPYALTVQMWLQSKGPCYILYIKWPHNLDHYHNIFNCAQVSRCNRTTMVFLRSIYPSC